jgi:hypothetical protein
MRDFVFRLAFVVFCLTSTSMAIAQDECVPFNAEDTKIVDRGPVKTVVGPLAEFNPCHSSVRLDTPSFFAKKRGEKPPLVIIAHGGGSVTIGSCQCCLAYSRSNQARTATNPVHKVSVRTDTL